MTAEEYKWYASPKRDIWHYLTDTDGTTPVQPSDINLYVVDSSWGANGDPTLASRRNFVIGLEGAEGAAIDPSSGDFLFTTFGGGDRVIVVHGFTIP